MHALSQQPTADPPPRLRAPRPGASSGRPGFRSRHRRQRTWSARLLLRRDPAQAAPLRLDGENLQLLSIALDGEPLPPPRIATPATCWKSTAPATAACWRPACGCARRRTPRWKACTCPARARAGFLLTQCEAEGFRHITFFPDRPDVLSSYTVTLRADRDALPGAAGRRQPGRRRRAGRRPALGALRRSAPEAELPVRPGRRPTGEASSATTSPPMAAHVQLKIWAEADAIDRCHYAMDALERAMRWDEQAYRPQLRPGRVPRRRHARLQHGRDGEQGPQHLQREVPAGRSGHRPPTTSIATSRRWSRTSTSTTGAATASPAATGSSCR